MSSLVTIVQAADPSGTPAPASGGIFGIDPLTIVFVIAAAVLIFFMWRNSRKQRERQQELRSKILPGAEVMTQQGIYGTLLSLDEDDNTAIIETTPGTRLRVHSQTIARVVEDEPTPADDAIESADGDSADGDEPADGSKA